MCEKHYSILFYDIFLSYNAKYTLVVKIKGTTCFDVLFFVHNSSINERKNLKFIENIYYAMIN